MNYSLEGSEIRGLVFGFILLIKVVRSWGESFLDLSLIRLVLLLLIKKLIGGLIVCCEKSGGIYDGCS